ncbi:MAG TPA: c-type cytochrome [Vicinamibacterales bacterium]|nr:c-type cytochrome [Vicinamibacterales bacterium]
MRIIPIVCLAVALSGIACTRAEPRGPLIGASTTMVTAWQVPQNPLEGGNPAGVSDQRVADQIKWGFKIFTDTPHEAARFTGGTVSCANCHLNAGQRDRALPLVGVVGMFPEYNARAARLITLADRVVDCFMRSENAPGARPGPGEPREPDGSDALPTPASKEVIALSAYITWLSRGQAVGQNPPWRGHNAIASANLLPIDKLDPRRGEEVYKERCTSCHGVDGQGVQVGDKKAGPLWGPNSWNDGAGASRVYTLAGIVRYTMPYLDPGGLSDADAQHVAAFITSQPRPAYPFKDRDYVGGRIPVDAVYYGKSNNGQ